MPHPRSTNASATTNPLSHLSRKIGESSSRLEEDTVTTTPSSTHSNSPMTPELDQRAGCVTPTNLSLQDDSKRTPPPTPERKLPIILCGPQSNATTLTFLKKSDQPTDKNEQKIEADAQESAKQSLKREYDHNPTEFINTAYTKYRHLYDTRGVDTHEPRKTLSSLFCCSTEKSRVKMKSKSDFSKKIKKQLQLFLRHDLADKINTPCKERYDRVFKALLNPHIKKIKQDREEKRREQEITAATQDYASHIDLT